MGLVDVSKSTRRLYVALYIEVLWVLEPIESVCKLRYGRQVAVLVACLQILGVRPCHAIVWWSLNLLLRLIVHVCHRVLHFRLHKGIVLGWRRLREELLA